MLGIPKILGSVSKKYSLAFISVGLIILSDSLGLNLSPEKILSIAGIVSTYLVGQSVVDTKKISK